MKKILIVSAMIEELKPLLKLFKQKQEIEKNLWHAKVKSKDIYFLVSNIGKSNIASAIGYMVGKYQIEYVINIGMSGSLLSDVKHLDIIQANQVRYFDFDLRQFNYKLGQIPGHFPHFKTSNLFSLDKKGLIVSGDIFVDKNKLDDIKKWFSKAIAVDMESAACGHIATKLNIKWDVVRIISDSGSTAEYHDNKTKACAKLALKINEIIKTL